MEAAMSPEDLIKFKGFLSKILKPTFKGKINLSPKTNWLTHFKNLHATGECFVTEEFLTTIIPAYDAKDIPCSELIGFQAIPDSDTLAKIIKDHYEWWFSHKMIMEEIRHQGFDPITHPSHIAWEIKNRVSSKKSIPIFYMKGLRGKVCAVEIRFDLEEYSDREDKFFESRWARGEESECPSILIMDMFEPGAEGDVLQLVTSPLISNYTFVATK